MDQLLAQRMETWRSGESLLAANAAARREAQLRHEEFLGLAQKFLTRWNDLAVAYNQRGAVDPKKFKAVSKAFRNLEKSEGWLAPK